MEYKLAEIYYGAKTGKDITKEWYVYYSYRYPIGHANAGRFKRFIVKMGINRFHGLRERTKEAQLVREAINLELKSGQLSPFGRAAKQKPQPKPLGLKSALEYALSIKNLESAHKTWLDYRSRLKFIYPVITDLGLEEMNITMVKRGNIKDIMNELLRSGISQARYNAFLDTLKIMFGQLLKDEKIEASPIHGIPKLKLPESEGFRPYPEHKARVKELAYKEGFRFGLIVETLYITGIRPNELLGLQWDRINFTTGMISILPQVMIEKKVERITKTRKLRYIRMSPALLEKYKSLYESNGSPDQSWFIFSKKRTYESGPIKLHRNRLTDHWRKAMHGNGLDKSVKMYGLKHTRADDLIEAGVPIEFVKELFGHHSTKITRIYAKKMNEKAAETILNMGGDF